MSGSLLDSGQSPDDAELVLGRVDVGRLQWFGVVHGGQFAGGEVPSVAARAPVHAAFDLRFAAVVGPCSAELGESVRFGGVPPFGGAHRGVPVVGHAATPSASVMAR